MKHLLFAAIACACLTQSTVGAQPLAASRFALTIDGQQAGSLSSVSGGYPYGTVVQLLDGPDRFARKHLGSIRYEPVTVELGIAAGGPLQQWISSTLRGELVRHDGAIIGYDNQLVAVQQRTFRDALITEVTFPALDASSREPGYLTVVLAPEVVELSKASGSATQVGQSRQRPFITSNFRLDLDGLDTSRVSKIDAFAVKQKVTEDAVGTTRDSTLQPATLEIPNLTVTMTANAGESWQRWFEEFVIQGQNDDSREKSGRIVLLGPNKEELLAITLSKVGIFAWKQLTGEANNDRLSRFEARLYVERMELTTK